VTDRRWIVTVVFVLEDIKRGCNDDVQWVEDGMTALTWITFDTFKIPNCYFRYHIPY